MTLPDTWTQVPVARTYLRSDGRPCRGRVLFTAGAEVLAAGITVVPHVLVGALVDGVLRDARATDQPLRLPSVNDPDISPRGWTWEVDETGVEGVDQPPWLLQVDENAEVIDLATAAPVVPVGEYTTYLTRADLGSVVARQGALTDLTVEVADVRAIAVAAAEGKADRLDLFAARATRTLYIAHRMGGGVHAPENSYAAARGVSALDQVLEADVQRLADGSYGVMHDPTVDRTTTAAGNVAAQDVFSWSDLRFRPVASGIPAPDEAPPTWAELLDQWGGKRPLLVEAKDDAITAQRLVDDVVARGLQRSVMATSFDLADLAPAVAAGMPTMWNSNAPTAAALAGTGVEWVSVTRGSITAQLVQEMHAAGVKVAAYTINQRSHRDAMLAAGVDGIVTEQPLYVPHDHGRRTDPYRVPGTVAPGHVLVRGSDPGRYDQAAGSFGWSPTSSQNAMVLGWASPVASASYRVRFAVDMLAGAADQTRFVGLYVCVSSDDGISEANGGLTRGEGYSLTVRRNGTCGFFRITAGVATKLKDGWTLGAPVCADVNSAGSLLVEAEVTPSTIYWRRLNPDGTLDIESTTDDTTYRGGRYLQITQGGTGAMFRNFTITPL